jgi:hypothetical protein
MKSLENVRVELNFTNIYDIVVSYGDLKIKDVKLLEVTKQILDNLDVEDLKEFKKMIDEKIKFEEE